MLTSPDTGGEEGSVLIPILSVLALFVFQTLLGPTIRYVGFEPGVGDRLRTALGPRDAPPPETRLSGRASRALANLQEALPVFLTLALLHEIHGTGGSVAPWAFAFLAARIAYVPAYLSGVPGLRSTTWVLGWAGLAGMIAPLIRPV